MEKQTYDHFNMLSRLTCAVESLETRNRMLENEIKMLKEKHRQEIQDWQKACSVLEDEILEIQEREGV